MTLNKKTTTLTPEFKMILKFYGYNVDDDNNNNNSMNTTKITPTISSTPGELGVEGGGYNFLTLAGKASVKQQENFRGFFFTQEKFLRSKNKKKNSN